MVFWIEREERDIKILSFEMIRVEPQIYIEKRSLIDRESIEHLLSKQRLLRIGSMDRAIYREVSRTNPEISIEETCIKVLSSIYQEA